MYRALLLLCLFAPLLAAGRELDSRLALEETADRVTFPDGFLRCSFMTDMKYGKAFAKGQVATAPEEQCHLCQYLYGSMRYHLLETHSTPQEKAARHVARLTAAKPAQSPPTVAVHSSNLTDAKPAHTHHDPHHIFKFRQKSVARAIDGAVNEVCEDNKAAHFSGCCKLAREFLERSRSTVTMMLHKNVAVQEACFRAKYCVTTAEREKLADARAAEKLAKDKKILDDAKRRKEQADVPSF